MPCMCLKLTFFYYVFQFYVTYDLYIAAFAGAGITLLALVSYFCIISRTFKLTPFKQLNQI